MKLIQFVCIIILFCSMQLGRTASFTKNSITVYFSNLSYDTCYITEYDISGTKIQDLTNLEGSCALSRTTLDASGSLLVAALTDTLSDSVVVDINPNGVFVDGTSVPVSSVNIITPMVSGTDVWMQDSQSIAYTTHQTAGLPETQTIAPTTWGGISVQYSVAQLVNTTLYVVNKATNELLKIDPIVKTGTGTTTKVLGTVTQFYVHNGSHLYVHVGNTALKKYSYQNGAATLKYSISLNFTADSITAIEIDGITYVLLSYKADTTYTIVRYTDTGSTFNGETDIIQTTQLEVRSVTPSPKATCFDGWKDQDETDTDCGGSICAARCDTLYACVSNSDCISGFCNYGCASGVCNSFGVCTPTACDDGAKNQDETDVDCGGSKCAKCADEKSCNVAADCLSGVCNADASTCAVPSCEDSVMNGDETDIDCGGNSCSGCAIGKKCLANSDCVLNNCINNLCAASCQDNSLNQNETDIDCGGNNCYPCANNKTCVSNTDCLNGFCNPDSNVCNAPTCQDTYQNQDETDIDCGGSNCSKCAVGKKCVMDSDCETNTCANNSCGPSTPIKEKPVSVGCVLETAGCFTFVTLAMIM